MDLLLGGSGSVSLKKIWENQSLESFPAQEISVPGLSNYDGVIIITNSNGTLAHAYNNPSFAPNINGSESYVTSYQGDFHRNFTIYFSLNKIGVGDAVTAGVDNRYLIPVLIYGIKF